MDGDSGESNFGHRPSICRQGIATQGLCNLFCLGKNCLAFGELDKVEGRTDLKIEIQENFLVTKQLFMSSYYGQFERRLRSSHMECVWGGGGVA